jgi:hypothetical protein
LRTPPDVRARIRRILLAFLVLVAVALLLELVTR